MKLLPVAVLAACLLSITFNPAGVVAQDGVQAPPASHILRMPSLSPDGETLAFVYDGDIWSVATKGGVARRLTITVDNDGDPKFSPDGKWLAFRSRRYGNDSVFVMPSEGGPAKRLTFADTLDIPHCWLPDSSGVIFSSSRNGGRDLWVVRLEGGEPWPITSGGYGVHEYGADISPDGKHIVYSDRGGDPTRRRGYTGKADGDIWLCDFDGVTTRNHRRLTENDCHDAWPVFVSNSTIAWVSYQSEDGSTSRHGLIAQMDLKGKRKHAPTEQPALDAKELAFGGGRLAFATGAWSGWKLHYWQTNSAHPFSLHTPTISLNTDVRTPGYSVEALTTAAEFAVSPDGKKLAFIAGGDVFVMPADETAVPTQLTDTAAREQDLDWSPDSNRLAFTTRESPQDNFELAVVNFADPEHAQEWDPETPWGIAAIGVSHTKPKFHPLHNEVWVIEEEGLVLPVYVWNEAAPYEAKPVAGMFHGAEMRTGDYYQFSPDGKWLLYSQSNPLYNSTLMLANLETGDVSRISFLYGSCVHARFANDGKRIVFVNNQEGDYDLWTIDLTPPPVEFKEDKLGELFKPKPKPDADSKPAAKTPETKVVIDGIGDRAKRITSLDGNEFSPVALKDGITYCFIGNSQGQPNVWKLTIDPDKGPDMKQLTQSRTAKSQLTLSADEKTLWWLEAGRISSMGINGGKVTTYNFRVEQRRDIAEMRRVAFHEAVWVMQNYYYDRSHHGISWADTAKRYEAALESVSTGDEYGALMNELLGELNSSHQGYTAVDGRSPMVSESTGCLGLLFDAAELAKGRYKITEVIKDGPCDVEGKPEVGSYLVGLNRSVLAAPDNLASRLLGSVGRKTTLHFNATPEYSTDKLLSIKPISRGAEGQLFYRRWVQAQRDMVEELSGGRLGYVHIRAMNSAAVRDFKHHLGNEMLGKDGVVIDVRYNGGGSTAVDLLEILIKRPWLKRQWGELEDVSENIYRSVALEKPSTLLINEASFSNAEIMAEGFRRLGIGTIVGVDTAGGVIGTGSFGLIDGSRMRLPSTGAFTVDGENLELFGRKPDIFVENHPDELDKGIDRQTEAAVADLLKQLK